MNTCREVKLLKISRAPKRFLDDRERGKAEFLIIQKTFYKLHVECIALNYL